MDNKEWKNMGNKRYVSTNKGKWQIIVNDTKWEMPDNE